MGAARTGWGAGPGRAARLSLRAAGRAARCCARCPADPTVSAAPEPGCGGGDGGGRAAGGAGRGRAEDGVTWAGPAARDTPPTGAVLSPRDWASPGGPPRPGARTLSEPQPAAGTLGRTPPSWAELEARRPSCWVPARGLRDGRAQLPQPAAAGTAAPPWPRPAAPRRRLGAGIPGRPRRSHRSESRCHSREPSH